MDTQAIEAYQAYEEWKAERTTKVGEHHNMVVMVIDPKDKYGFLMTLPDELDEWMDGHCIADVLCEGCPQEAGIYVCTIERHFEQGYSEGYKADGESDYWIVLTDVRKVDVSPYMQHNPHAGQEAHESDRTIGH